MTYAGQTDTLQPPGVTGGGTGMGDTHIVRARRYLCGTCYTITRVPLPTHEHAK